MSETRQGSWSITGTSIDAGWLLLPADLDPDAARSWIQEQTSALRAQWGQEWSAEAEHVITELLRGGLERRREEDALAFQLWLGQRPLCLYVHVAIGARDPQQALPGPGDGMLFDAPGLGPGVLVPSQEDVDGLTAVGFDVVFACEDDAMVLVSVEPTLIDLLGLASPSIQSFIGSLELVGPDGRVRRALSPALLEAQPENTWVDTLTTP